MLVELHVVDLGIVADLNLVLGAGLTAITGETGAGKTLLVEAVELLVGGRADAGLVRDGAAEARVEGRFVHPETGEETVLARVVPRDGRSRAYVDGRLATVGELAEAGRALVDLHGQHAHQSLLDPRSSGARSIATPARPRSTRWRATATHAPRCASSTPSSRHWVATRAPGPARSTCSATRSRRSPRPASRTRPKTSRSKPRRRCSPTRSRTARRSSAPTRRSKGRRSTRVGTALAALDGRAPFAALAARLRGAQGELADIEQELRREVERVDDDPARVDAVRGRRHQLHELGRKYGSTLADVIAYGAESAARLDELERYEERAADLEARRAAHEREATAAAADLSAARRAAAEPLGTAVSGHLRELAMPHATVEIEVEPGPATDDGVDQVTYLLAANPGERARPLARAASGGELSRAMLAARVVLSEAPPTLVFDEVDAGIGGEAGASVGRLLQALGTRHQVLCVTHLAQVAAFAGTQVVVEKAVEREKAVQGRQERTVAHAAVVDGDERVAELSRMLAGVGDSSHARGHAAELLATAAGAAPARVADAADGDAVEAWPDGRDAATESTRVMARLRLRKKSDAPFAIQGPARVDRRTKDMIPRLQAGEIAVINHRDLDRVAADGLIEAGVIAVVNCAPSISGRYPNGGPIRIVQAGITLIDDVGVEFMDTVSEGDVVRIEDGELWRNGELLGRGRELDEAGIEVAMEAARDDDRHRARALRRQHARVHPEGGAAHVRAADPAAVAHQVRRTPRARRRARPRLPLRPRGAAPVHP